MNDLLKMLLGSMGSGATEQRRADSPRVGYQKDFLQGDRFQSKLQRHDPRGINTGEDAKVNSLMDIAGMLPGDERLKFLYGALSQQGMQQYLHPISSGKIAHAQTDQALSGIRSALGGLGFSNTRTGDMVGGFQTGGPLYGNSQSSSRGGSSRQQAGPNDVFQNVQRPSYSTYEEKQRAKEQEQMRQLERRRAEQEVDKYDTNKQFATNYDNRFGSLFQQLLPLIARGMR